MNGQRRSKIDHVLVPRNGLHRLREVRADYAAMRDLQLVSRSDLYDHAPVVGVIDVTVAHPPPGSRPGQVSREKVMEALLTGERRDIYIEAINSSLCSFRSEWRDSLSQRMVCAAWAMIEHVMHDAARSAFPPDDRGDAAGDVVAECVARRGELLRRRSQLRRDLAGK